MRHSPPPPHLLESKVLVLMSLCSKLPQEVEDFPFSKTYEVKTSEKNNEEVKEMSCVKKKMSLERKS